MKALRRSALIASVLGAACSGATGALPTTESEIKLAVSDHASVPLPEISALAVRERAGKVDLIVLGDRVPEIAIGELRSDLDDVDFKKTNVRAALEEAKVAQDVDVQWEAVSADATGRIFVLEENPGRVFVFTPDLSRIEKVVDLKVSTQSGASESLAKAWADSANSRGEGLLLLASGHVLIAKEKDPRRLIELGPEGDRAVGMRPLSRRGTFTLPSAKRTSFVVLKEWKLDHDAEKDLPDLADLAVDDEGSIFVLSDEGATIAQLEKPDGDTVGIEEKWTLRDVEKPEGLVLVDGHAIITSDLHKNGKNLFRTKRLR